MKRKKISLPSPAMVVALLALFISMGGASYAMINLPKNSVGTKQIKNGAVTARKVKSGTLLAKNFKAGELKAGAQGPTGSQGPQGSQGATGVQGTPGTDGTSATAYWVVVNPGLCSGSCTLPRSSGVSSVVRTSTGSFTATFTTDVSNCADIATIGQTEGGSLTDGGQVSTLRNLGDGTQVIVTTFDKAGSAIDRWFHLAVFC